MKSDAIFEENLVLGSKNDTRNLMNLVRAVASVKISTLMCHFCRKFTMFELKKYRGVMCHKTEE